MTTLIAVWGLAAAHGNPTQIQHALTICFFNLFVVFKQLDEDFLACCRQDGSTDGSTCLLGMIFNGRLTIANIGDSVATLARKDGSWEQLNAKHNPNRPDERMRIEAANG